MRACVVYTRVVGEWYESDVSLAMRNAMVFDEMRQREIEREMIFSSISSHIIKVSTDGRLEWCNAPRQLEKALGVKEGTMRSTNFSSWLPQIKTSGPESSSVSLAHALTECLETGKRSKARNAEMRSDSAESEIAGVFNFACTPLMRADLSENSGVERRVGALLVLEDASDTHKRKHDASGREGMYGQDLCIFLRVGVGIERWSRAVRRSRGGTNEGRAIAASSVERTRRRGSIDRQNCATARGPRRRDKKRACDIHV